MATATCAEVSVRGVLERQGLLAHDGARQVWNGDHPDCVAYAGQGFCLHHAAIAFLVLRGHDQLGEDRQSD